MDARAAGQITRAYCAEHAPNAKARAREVSFEDLARGSRVCVTITNAPPYSDRGFWDAIQATGRAEGFSVT